jgi:hypothetical protein
MNLRVPKDLDFLLWGNEGVFYTFVKQYGYRGFCSKAVLPNFLRVNA